MNLHELVEHIRDYEKAERDVADAELSIRHGGDEETMRRKREALHYAQKGLQIVGNREMLP